MKKSICFKEGQEASKNGRKARDNPYKSNTAFAADEVQRYKEWLDGWLYQKGFKIRGR